ncbi:ABC transporter permease [Bacteroidota bacterium]
MFINYLKVFLRLFSRNRVFTIINLLGLSVGIACFVLIRLYVINETSYDLHLPGSEKTYRLGMKGEMSGFSFEAAVMGGPFGAAIREDVPEVATSTTFYKYPRPILLSREENQFYEESIIYADSGFLDFFGYKSILGNPGKMLEIPYSMVLTRSGANKYFGQENPIGKVISWNNQRDYTVTGIIEDPVLNSHMKVDILASYSSLLEQDAYKNLLTTFYAFVTYNYIKLKDSAKPSEVEKKIAEVLEKHMGEGMRESGSRFEIFLQPVLDIHLNSNLVHELQTNGNRTSVYIFSAISLLILLIACVNFVNLTTARSASRVHEIGIRQVNGAGKSSLFSQFMLESIFFAVCSVLLAGILIGVTLAWFYNFSGINPASIQYSKPEFIALLLLLGVSIGVFAGLYPSVYLSRSRPFWMLKGATHNKSLRIVFRNSLVVVQLAITLFLVFNTILIYKQLQLISETGIGINKDELLVIPMRSSKMYDQYEVLKHEMLLLPGVKKVTASSVFLGNFQQRRGFYVEGFDRNDMWMLHYLWIDPDYTDVMETGLILGRGFRAGSRADSNAVIINAAMMKQAEWENPIGKKVTMQEGGILHEYTVIGVVDDFNYASIHNKVESLLIFNDVHKCRYLGVRVHGGESSAIVKSIGDKWNSLYPEYPFDYFFQEDFYDDLYREDQKMGKLFIYFTILAILISVLGLFGLVLFSSSRRTREVGIRKAMGGDASAIVFLLLKEYPLFVLIASLFSLPMSWYFANRWLENFAYKTDISSWIYIFSVVLVLMICTVTILFQTLRTARANPVDALRYE